MKTYKNITYGLLALSLMVFFTAVQAWAFYEKGDLSAFENNTTNQSVVSNSSNMTKSNPMEFKDGRNAGFEAGKENINSCFIGSTQKPLDDDLSRGKSREFVAGYNSGYNEVATLYNYSYCGR